MTDSSTTRSSRWTVSPAVPRTRRFLRAVSPAAGVVGLIWFSARVLVPLHQRGIAQTPLAVLNGLSSLLRVPFEFLLRRLFERLTFTRRFGIRPWWTFLFLTFLIYLAAFAVAGAAARRLKQWGDRGKPSPSPPDVAGQSNDPSEPGRPTRRTVVLAGRVVARGALVAAAYPLLVEPRRIAVTRHSFAVRGLAGPLDGLRVVQLTDIHLGEWNSVAYVRRIVEATNALEADLVVLTGDYVLHSAEYTRPVAGALAGLRATLGVVGVLGNHDWWEDGMLAKRELTRVGVRMVDNDRLFVTPSRRLTAEPGDGLCVAGVGDLWTDQQLYDRALGGLPDEMPRLLLSHNPDVAEERAFVGSGHRVDLMLSGHTHGGQIFLPAVGAPVTMSRYGQKYVRGLVRGPACPVYVSRGLGMAMLPLRFGSVPEIAVIELART